MGIDAILHVNHMLDSYCGMLIVFNPRNETMGNQTLEVDLYYTGAKGSILIKREEADKYTEIALEDEYFYTLQFDMPARNLSYWLFDCTNTNVNKLLEDALLSSSQPVVWI